MKEQLAYEKKLKKGLFDLSGTNQTNLDKVGKESVEEAMMQIYAQGD